MLAYKFLKTGAVGLVSGFAWPVPRDNQPGAWVETSEPLSQCVAGVHVCRRQDLPYWLYDELWEVEIDGETVEGLDMLVARRGRLVRRVEGWSSQGRARFLAACDERARRLVRDTPHPSGHADAFLTFMPGYVEKQMIPLGALCAAFAVAALQPEEDAIPAYRSERAWQAQWLADDLGLA